MGEKKFSGRALGNVVIVLKPEINKDTESGLFKGNELIKEESKLAENTYLEVIAVGPKTEEVKVGDKIVVGSTIHALVVDGVECGYLYEPSVVMIK